MMAKVLPPIFITAMVAVIGATAVWAGQPWMVPSQGSAAFVQTMTPELPSARWWNVGVGQLLGAVFGVAGVCAGQALSAPIFTDHNPLLWTRVAAAAIAVLLTSVSQLACKAGNPAGGATAPVVALGTESTTWEGFGRLVAGIVLVTLLGEIARRITLRTR